MRPEFEKADSEKVLRMLASEPRFMELPLKTRNTIAFYLVELAAKREMSILGVAAALYEVLEHYDNDTQAS